MALAPHPSRVSKGDANAEDPIVVSGPVTLVDTTGSTAIQMRQMIRLLLWENNKQILDMFETVCLSDEQWNRVRRQLLRILNNEERSIIQQVASILEKEKDTDGNQNG